MVKASGVARVHDVSYDIGTPYGDSLPLDLERFVEGRFEVLSGYSSSAREGLRQAHGDRRAGGNDDLLHIEEVLWSGVSRGAASAWRDGFHGGTAVIGARGRLLPTLERGRRGRGVIR